MLSGNLLGGDDERRSAVVDARSVAGGDGAALPEGCLEPGERLDRRGARMLVAVDDDRATLPLGDGDGDDLARKAAVRLGGRGLCLAAQGEGVLVLARDLVVFGDVLASYNFV